MGAAQATSLITCVSNNDSEFYGALKVLIDDAEGGIAREEPARHQAKADGLSGHHRKLLGPRQVRLARGVPDDQVLLRQAGSVLHELGQAGDCLGLIGEGSGRVPLALPYYCVTHS
jgi:hypothetical protein